VSPVGPGCFYDDSRGPQIEKPGYARKVAERYAAKDADPKLATPHVAKEVVGPKAVSPKAVSKKVAKK